MLQYELWIDALAFASQINATFLLPICVATVTE